MGGEEGSSQKIMWYDLLLPIIIIIITVIFLRLGKTNQIYI